MSRHERVLELVLPLLLDARVVEAWSKPHSASDCVLFRSAMVPDGSTAHHLASSPSCVVYRSIPPR